MEKMETKMAAQVRSHLYEIAETALNTEGFTTEPIKGGVLIDLGNGYFAKMAISVCDASKFDVEAEREEQVASMIARMNRAAEAKQKEEAKMAEKVARLSKELDKVTKTTSVVN